MADNTNIKLNFALQLTRFHGLRVFPIQKDGTRPAVKFSKYSSKDLDKIKAWWRTDARNIGVHTGEGVFVVDVDTDKGGDRTLQSLLAMHEPFPPTLVVRTPSGGAHYYFSCDEKHNVRNSASKIGEGIDIRGHNGYVVGPGSVRAASGKKLAGEYQMAVSLDQPIAQAPEWLLQLVLSPPAKPIENSVKKLANGGTLQVIPRGARNDTLFREGCAMRAQGATETVIRGALMARNAEETEDPLSETEVRTIAAQCAKYPPGENSIYYQRKRKREKKQKELVQISTFVRRLSEYDSKDLKYLWGHYFPRASVSIVAGNPGQKKTAFMIRVAAAITRGERLFEGNQVLPYGSVMLATSEDSIEHTIRTRFDAAGGDMSRFFVLPSDLNIMEQWEELDTTIEDIGDVKLIIIDPITAFMQAGADGNSNTDVRTIMRAVHELAEKHNLSVVGISHLNKDQSKSVWARLLGSIAWNAAARAVYMIGADPQREDVSIVACAKTNFVEPPAIEFAVKTVQVETTTGPKDEMYLDVSAYEGDMTIDEIFQTKRLSKLEFMEQWLKHRLGDGNMVAAVTLKKEAQQRGYSWTSISKVANTMKPRIERHKSREKDGRWYWSMPSAMLPDVLDLSPEDFKRLGGKNNEIGNDH